MNFVSFTAWRWKDLHIKKRILEQPRQHFHFLSFYFSSPTLTMKSPLLFLSSLVLIFVLGNRCDALRLHRRGDPVGYFMDWTDGRWHPKMDRVNLLMVGEKEPDGSRKVRKNCIFYVNQKNVDPSDPNYAKNRALQFAEMMNLNAVGSDHHTLYDVYDLEAAFGLAPGSTRQDAIDRNLERPWFEATSAAFAQLCSGLVYLVVEPEDIWDGAIWVTHELPAILNTGLVTEIVEVRPEDIGRAYEGGATSVYSIPMIPYRGGQPNGSTPPRDPDRQLKGAEKTQIPMVNTLAGMDNLDVSGDNTPPSLDPPSDWSGSVCAGYSYAILDGGLAFNDDQDSAISCQPQNRTDPYHICDSPLFTCDGAAACPPECEPGSPDISAIHISGQDFDCTFGPTGPNIGYCGRGPVSQCGAEGPNSSAPSNDNAPINNATSGAAVLSNSASTTDDSTLSVSGALEGESSPASSSFDKWAPAIVGLLSGNMFLTLLLAAFTIFTCFRRRQARTYAPLSESARSNHRGLMREQRGYRDDQYEE
ncbi:hypothetical protein DL96DRAFT_1758744 [Flagelloscypha sp. PMI_526]|nr:hypothetical protein DL96DRAFT_1758744 [Flagelloscypha sp. PMI_526]